MGYIMGRPACVPGFQVNPHGGGMKRSVHKMPNRVPEDNFFLRFNGFRMFVFGFNCVFHGNEYWDAVQVNGVGLCVCVCFTLLCELVSLFSSKNGFQTD